MSDPAGSQVVEMPSNPRPPQQAADLRSHPTRRWGWFVALLLALTLWGLLDVRRRGYLDPENPAEHKTDFTVYTEAGAAFFDGRPPYDVANPRGWTYLYPPMLALVLAPLHALPTQDQVTVWFFVSLLICWGCYRECVRILGIVGMVAPANVGWHWLGWMALVAAALPTLNCLQRGQVGILKFYLLLLGVRLILGGRSYRAWVAGGIVLAMPIVMKIIPIVPVGFFLFVQLVAAARQRWGRCATASPEAVPLANALHCLPGGKQWHTPMSNSRQLAGSLAGVALGLLLFFLLIPAALIGWHANLRHLNTWADFMLTKLDDGGVDPRSGNSRSMRNQSLQNAAYRLGNFTAHVLAGSPDDRLVESDTAPEMPMDAPLAQTSLELVRAVLLLALLLVGVRLGRCGDVLSQALAFGLGCVAMLVASPVARGHYFMLVVPAMLLLPLWLDQRRMPRAATVMAVAPAALSVLHYLLLPWAGRIGLLGMGTACWLMAAMLLVDRAARQSVAPPPHAAEPDDAWPNTSGPSD